MIIQDRECHHIVMNRMHFRCIQYESENTTLLLGEHKPVDTEDDYAMYLTPCDTEAKYFMKAVSDYMNGLEDQVIAKGKRCVLADTKPRENGAIFYGEVTVSPSGERTYTASFAESIEALMERL